MNTSQEIMVEPYPLGIRMIELENVRKICVPNLDQLERFFHLKFPQGLRRMVAEVDRDFVTVTCIPFNDVRCALQFIPTGMAPQAATDAMAHIAHASNCGPVFPYPFNVALNGRDHRKIFNKTQLAAFWGMLYASDLVGLVALQMHDETPTVDLLYNAFKIELTFSQCGARRENPACMLLEFITIATRTLPPNFQMELKLSHDGN